MYAYGFEDLTAAQWALVEGLAARADVTVSLPYEPGRLVFSALERTAATLSKHAAGRIEELPPASDRYVRPALAYLERRLFVDGAADPPEVEGAVRFLEAAARGACSSSWARRSSSSFAAEPIRPTSPSSYRRWSAGARRSRRRSPGSGSRTRPRARRGSARRRSAARCSRCSASRGSEAAARISSRSCDLRTPGSAATTSTSSKAGCAGARSTRPTAWRRRRSGCAASHCRSSTSCGQAARTRRR